MERGWSMVIVKGTTFWLLLHGRATLESNNVLEFLKAVRKGFECFHQQNDKYLERDTCLPWFKLYTMFICIETTHWAPISTYILILVDISWKLNKKQSMVVHAYNPCIWDIRTGGSEVQGQLPLAASSRLAWATWVFVSFLFPFK